MPWANFVVAAVWLMVVMIMEMFVCRRFGTLAALELGCLGLGQEVSSTTVDCLRQKSVISLLSTEIFTELMAQPSIGELPSVMSYLSSS